MTSLGTLWFEAGDMFSGYYDDTTGIANAGTFKLSHTLVTAAGAYDVAEDYPTNEDDLMAGDILAFDEHEKGYVRKATPGDDARLAGVVSGRPGFLLSAKDRSGMVPMALAGRVEVQVGPENGPVHVGDSITLSSTTPGVGVRASFGDSAIGYALEPLSESVATTTILVYVTHNQSLQMGVDLETLSGTIELHGSTVMERLIALASNFVDGVLRVAGIRTNELCIGATCVNEAQLIEILNKTNTHTDVDEYEEVETPQGDEEVIETPPDTTGATTSPDIPPQEEIPEPETITSDEVVSGILPGSDTEPLPTTEQTNITPTE
jgi:hypothetical protein